MENRTDGLRGQLHQLVVQACQHPPGSPERQKNLTRIVSLVRPKLWRETTAYYQDALQQTWMYFCQNICEANTGEAYDPERSSLITWLNFYLKRQLQQFFVETQKQQARTISASSIPFGDGDDQARDPIDRLAAPADVPPLLESVREWIERDVTGELRRIHIANHPEVNCQVLLLRRLPPEVSWKDLSTEFNLPISSLSNFYQRQCLPRLCQFGKAEGYLEP
jgi:hypothetical protein